MTVQFADPASVPSREEAQRALELLRQWAGGATQLEIADLDPAVGRLLPETGRNTYPSLSRTYPEGFRADESYRASMPDLQNGPESLIRGARRRIQHVGISNFRLPIRYHTRDGGDLTLETSVTGSVSLEAGKKGINMSRIMRSFYRSADRTFSFEVIEDALEGYRRDLDSFDARIAMRFSFPMRLASLRSGL
ncbi:GTP cyclohydrolase, FolE2/MptA family, partial [Tropicimonas sp.]|uniref:GTP cyclohydrolase, FolE2/MptA family n=1 Tax=Tropicimonas sp. TaxID=2067044 RepID=UPI003A874E2C